MKQTLREPYVWIFAAFLCLYTGSETTVGGWSVSFLLVERHANRAVVGYVASGLDEHRFWGGLAAGRLFFGQLSPTIGLRIEKHLVHIFIFVAVVLELLVLFVPSFLTNSVCIGFVGFVLGPLYPISLSIATKLLPPPIHLTALATMSSSASIGSALFPFLAGVIANSTSVKAIEPMVLILLSGMAGLWFLFPSRFQS
ncbi:hypothetical protein BS47DRAFT_1357438 [Hydnum rufescens UP504]|uniref:Major facilitator superfamily (MFS) profile domain-containing protein n=1 Tax=Hydnum rufescens UP504 TaxID=1448309 RepID=A0A9P6BB53_9AGAM|nr:hypothetical protein BS47DRAFT_1357438 [Hydnum rufescens UP504]